MIRAVRVELMRVATRYIWWDRPAQAVRHPLRVIAQLMNFGDPEDVQRTLAVLGMDAFRDALAHAKPGWFNERSWHYWCHRLGMTSPGEPVPSMPTRE